MGDVYDFPQVFTEDASAPCPSQEKEKKWKPRFVFGAFIQAAITGGLPLMCFLFAKDDNDILGALFLFGMFSPLFVVGVIGMFGVFPESDEVSDGLGF